MFRKILIERHNKEIKQYKVNSMKTKWQLCSTCKTEQSGFWSPKILHTSQDVSVRIIKLLLQLRDLNKPTY